MDPAIEYLLATVGCLAIAVLAGLAQRKYTWLGYLTGSSVLLAACAALLVVVRLMPAALQATTVDAGMGLMIVSGVLRLVLFVVLYFTLRHVVQRSVRAVTVAGWRQTPDETQSQHTVDDSDTEPDPTTVEPASNSSRWLPSAPSRQNISIGPWRLDVGSDSESDDDYERPS